jgi:outer membrane receptor protein involved in Fe transport
MNFSPAEIRSLGGGASQFTINAGNPFTSVDQEDVGGFVGDNWRAASNLTVDLGLRYEWQTNLHDWRDFAPRVGRVGTQAREGKKFPEDRHPWWVRNVLSAI